MKSMQLYILFIWVCVSAAFNLDTEHALWFNGTREDFFGYSVHQYESETRKQIIVGAPLQRNSTGGIYTCSTDLLNCTILHQPDSESFRSFGLSVAVSSSATASVTSCSPYLPHECDGNSYLNGICYQFSSSLQDASNFTAALQECSKREVNLVFLFDGSNSMKSEEFDSNKKFITDIMKKLSNSSIKFAAVQFSTARRTVFDFNDYQNGSAEEKLNKEKQMSTLTNTHNAIDFVLINLFNNVSSGANLNAAKALVIITDGDPTDRDTKSILKKCDDQNILRYIIGVGNLDLNKLTSLASEPKQNNTFYIQDYGGLKGLLDNLQNKIYNIEGSQEAAGSSRQKELSQSGFSVVYHKDSVIVGAVGSNDWRGSLYEVTGSGSGFTEIEITDPGLNNDSYMGYSAVIGRRGNVTLLFSGAPRAEHKGQVTLFIKSENIWRVTRNMTGEQIGSYFGASLSMLDVDSDGDSDFVLVGAPLFHQSQPRAEGRLYVYALTDQKPTNIVNTCNVSVSNTGRFAATLASLKDLNGDGLTDVAVGAPLDDDGQGAIYIYMGHETHGINNKQPQRVSAQMVLSGLHQFGVSLSGLMDVNEDNLTDIVIGAQGAIVLLKARPVMSVSSQLSFSPKEINLTDFECPSTNVFHMFNLTSCFTMTERTSSTGSLNKSLNISLNLNMDFIREMNRGFFDQMNSSSRTLQQSVLLESKFSCFSFSVFMPRCVADTVSPLKIRLDFSQMEMLNGNSTAVLDIYSRTEEFTEVPFKRSCHSNISCVADLKLNFTFMNDTLLVVNEAHFMVLVSLENPGDDSFNTSIVLHYPEGLSLSKFETVKPSRTRSSCGNRDDDVMNRTTCGINLPVYARGTTTQFLGTFRVNLEYDWTDMTQMIITANSDNSRNNTDVTVKRTVAVQFAIDLAISVVAEDSVTYLNISLDDQQPKHLSIMFKVENLGVKALPVSVIFNMGCQSPHVTLKSSSVHQNITQCQFDQQDGRCGKFKCNPFHLQRFSSVLFNLTAHITLQNMKEYEHRYSFSEFRTDFTFNVSAHVEYNRTRYNQMSTGLKEDPHKSLAVVKVEFVNPPNRLLIICTGGGGGFILLIIILVLLLKCGFFKRKRPYEFPEEECETASLVEKPNDASLIEEKENGAIESGGTEKGSEIIPDPPNIE
ncbi:integrin alpha-D isoform X2 [Xyrauchen texanus]|uniref:integrin alpha-D isoform X2 n=1 Tax=Xyrauchen texanus TaxID=154827 RepID=UPI002241BCD5|nr:integrin alpha-D isoform X2 [Xyrauchen texanus]